MISKRVKLDFGKKKFVEVLISACKHYGQPSTDYDAIAGFIKKAKKKYWLDLGDQIEAITPSDRRRYSIGEHTTPVTEQMDDVVQMHKPAAKTCLGFIKGNHENSISKEFGDVSAQMAKRTGVPYLGMAAFLDLVCPKGVFQMYAAHGSKGFGGVAGDPERIKLNREIKLRNSNKQFTADLVAVAHGHTSVICPPVFKMRLGSIDNKIKMSPVAVDKTWYSANPAFFKTYADNNLEGSYGELAQYSPTHIGYHSAIIESDGTCSRMIQYGGDGEIISERVPNYIQ